jgi:hypothetical protein
MMVIESSMRLMFSVSVGAAVPYCVALVNVAAGFTVDAALRRAVHTVADGAELRGPRLLADEVALAVEVGESTAVEVAAAVAGGLWRAQGRGEAGGDRGS